MAKDKAICRICYESNNGKKNPLIKPCACRGSLAFIHLRCLQHWQHLDFERNGRACELCLAIYEDIGNPYMECIPTQTGYVVFFLRFPFIAGIFVHYVWLLHLSLAPGPHYNSLYVNYQLVFQLVYAALFALQFQVKHRSLYQKEWAHPGNLLLFLLHGFSLLYLFVESYAGGFMLNLLLGIYWDRHCRILRQMNERLLMEQT